MSQPPGRPATSGGGGQPRYGIGATVASPQQEARTTTPTTSNRTILDELLALGRLAESTSDPATGTNATRGRHRAPSEQPPANVTIIDYRDVAAPWHAPKEIVTPYDEFQSQWRSLAAAGAASTTDGNGGGDSTTSSSATLALPPAAPGGSGLAILDIRRTKTNRRKRGAARSRAHDQENSGPPLYARAESSDSDDYDEDQRSAHKLAQEAGQNRAGQAAASTSQLQARQQAAGQQQQQQQRQQSGETLSSFESDYDLLLYLGETETEDLVETERSLDYLDQTWRQSICGGASLAPTLDAESLSDFLVAHQNQQQLSSQHDDLNHEPWRPASGLTAPNRRPKQQQQQQQRARLTSNQNNLSPNQSYAFQAQSSSSSSLPRQSDLSAARPRVGQQQTLHQAAEVVGARAHTLRPRPANEQQRVTTYATADQRQQVAGAGLGSKFVSLFNRADKTPTSGGTTTRELDELLAGRESRDVNRSQQQQQQTMAPPKPARQRPHPVAAAAASDYEPPPTGGADELDRLLAEMSQSLDLDSLARYDPYQGGARRQANREVRNQTGKPNSQSTTKTTHPMPQTSQQQQRLYENQTPVAASSESILSDYDGASRMLEQMISDQLAEAAAQVNRPREQVPTKCTDTKSTDQSPTCSSSVATLATTMTQESVITARRDADEPHYSNQSAMWRHKQAVSQRAPADAQPPSATHQSESNLLAGGGPINRLRNLRHSPNYSRSLDTEMAPAHSQPTGTGRLNKPEVATNQPKTLSGRQESPRHSSRRSSATTTTGGGDIADTPPKPPAPDYGDFRPPALTSPSLGGGGQVIQVEAAEMSTTTTTDASDSEHEDEKGRRETSGQSRPHKKMISRMRRRTLTSMRQIRDKFGQLGGGGGAATSPTPPVIDPEPPKRSSSIASSSPRGGGSRSGGVAPEVGVALEIKPTSADGPATSPRQSRQRERKGPQAPPPPPGNAPELNAGDNVSQQPPAEGKKSLGRQWRERLSRSKSRFTQFIRGNQRTRRAQSTPDERRAAHEPAAISSLLAQPSDIARNERQTHESSLERHLRASLVNDVVAAAAPVAPATSRHSPPPASQTERKMSSASSRSLSSDLSGLEPVTKKAAGRFAIARPARGRSSGKRKSGTSGPEASDKLQLTDVIKPPPRKRPVSLISLKRFSESLSVGKAAGPQLNGSPDELQNLESAALRAKRKRDAAGKRQRNKSTGARLMVDDGSASPPTDQQQQLVNRKHTTTDDYFGLVAPLRTPGDDDDDELVRTPVSSVHQRVEMGPRVRPASVLLDAGDAQKQGARFALRRRADRRPNRSQSLKSQPAGHGPQNGQVATTTGGVRGHATDQLETGQKAVSFHNLSANDDDDPRATATHQRRQLSPVAPNTFRPVSAASAVATPPPLEINVARDVRYADSPVTPVQPTLAVGASLSPPRSPPVDATSSDSLHRAARSPTTRERGATLLGDIKSKYNKLFGPKTPRSKSTDQPELPVQLPPHRPPRRRNRKSNEDDSWAPPRRAKSLAAPRHQQAQPPEESDVRFIHELAPASPPLSLGGPISLTPSESPQPQPRATGAYSNQKPVKRLASFASQLRHSAVDFFNAGAPNSGQRKPATVSPQPPAVAATTSTIYERPKHFATRNLDEPTLPGDLAQWRPIIPTARAATGVKRSASFKLPKDSTASEEGAKEDYKKSHTLAGGRTKLDQQQQQQQRRSLEDSDSTWDSESGSERVEIVQGTQVHDAGESPPAKSRQPATTTTSGYNKQQQVCAAPEAQSAKGGVGSETSAAQHASGKLPATILQASASIGSEQRQRQHVETFEGNENEQKHALKTNSGSKNDQNNNTSGPSSLIAETVREETKVATPIDSRRSRHLTNQSDDNRLSLSRSDGGVTVGKPENKLADKESETTTTTTNVGQPPLVVCSNHWPLQTPATSSREPAANVQLFKFKDILPSPEQIREESRWRERRDQQQQQQVASERPVPVARTTTTGRAAAESGSLSSQADDQQASNRLSIYENVDLARREQQERPDKEPHRSVPTSGSKLDQNKQDLKEAQETKILSKQQGDDDMTRENLTATKATRAPPMAAEGNYATKKPAVPPRPQPPPPPRDEGEWSVDEPDERLIERMSARAHEQAADAGDGQQRAAKNSPPSSPSPVKREPPKRKLISMTSIIQEPEDELMNQVAAAAGGEQVVAVSSCQPRPVARDPRRDSALFERCGDSDDSDSSLAPPAQSGRKRLIDKLRGQAGQATTKEAPSRPPNLPHATGGGGGGGGGSLVKRLARNFDQTVQDQPASLGSLVARRSPAAISTGSSRSPQQQQQQTPVVSATAAANRRLPPGRLSLDQDEPKSDSTWYDAKSAELLDEAELAELLREFESDGLPAGGGAQSTQSTDREFVSVATNDSTLSHDEEDQRGRRDEARPTGGGEGDDPRAALDSDDPTLNDEQTLDDDDEDAGDGRPLEDEEAPTESESVYASLAAEANPATKSPTTKGKHGGELDVARDFSPVRPAHVESPASCSVAAAAAAKTACNLIAACPALRPPPTTAEAATTAAARDERVACTAAMQRQQQLQLEPRECITPPTGAVEAADTTTSCCCCCCGDNVARSSCRCCCSSPADNKNNINKCLCPRHAQFPPKPAPVSSPLPSQVRRDQNNCIDIDHEQHTEKRQQFKQSLNNIIASQQSQTRQSRSSDREHMRVVATPAPESGADCQQVPDAADKQKGTMNETTTTKPPKSNKCCKKASSLAKEISKCYKSLMGASDLAVKGKRQQVVERDSVPKSGDQIRDSVQEHDEQSDPDEDNDDDDDGDADFQLNTKDLVHAAKKCSQLYEELERLLQIRAAKQRSNKQRSLSSSLKPGAATGGEHVDDEEELEEEEEEDEESLLADLISEQSSQRGDDVISLSSSSLSSESLPELRQRKNLQKLYNIVNEICTSEEKFVATLKLLNGDFRRHILEGRWATGAAGATPSDSAYLHAHAHAHKVNLQQAPFDCIGLVLKHLPQLQALNENLLGEFKRAREQWPSTQKISHVLVKIGPFLKHYSSYIRNFDTIQAQFQENLKKSSHFRLAIHAFEACEASSKLNSGKLSVQHHLLKPIQRIPQYRLLLQQYLHHLKPDDADYEDTVEALEVVSRVAEHANQSLGEGANFAKLLALQAKVVGKQRDIIQPGRQFIKEGELLKVCRKQIQPCWFVLLNDSLLYLKQIQSSDILYLKYELPLDDCQVDLATERPTCPPQLSSEPPADAFKREDEDQQVQVLSSEERERQFNVCTTVRSMTLIARSRQERDEWLAAMRAAIGDQVAKRQSFKSASSKSRLQVAAAAAGGCDNTAALLDQQLQQELEQQQQLADASEALNELIGRKAPIWTPDARVARCESCTSNFSALFRRHHCRACGRVVCSACSSNKAPLIYLKCRAARVCDHCFESLRANMHLYYLPSCPIDERELKRLDEHFKTLLKAQFTRQRPRHHHLHKHKPNHDQLKPATGTSSPTQLADS